VKGQAFLKVQRTDQVTAGFKRSQGCNKLTSIAEFAAGSD